MKSLDDLLSEIAQAKFQDSLAEAISLQTWTFENRDQKMAQVRNIAEQLSEETVNFLKEMMETMINNRSLLSSKLLEQYIAGEIELLAGLRTELDNTLDHNTMPVDYNWLSENIRARYLELRDLTQANDKVLNPQPEVTDL